MVVPVLVGGAILVAAIAALIYVVFAMTDWWEILGISIAAVLIMMYLPQMLNIKIAGSF